MLKPNANSLFLRNSLWLRNAVLPMNDETGALFDVRVDEGVIQAICPAGQDKTGATREIELAGQWLLPGLVDVSASLTVSGRHSVEGIAQELLAAVAGGVTQLVTLPDSTPILDEPGLIEMLMSRVEKSGLAKVAPLGALTRQLAGVELSELVALKKAGCVAFTQALQPIANHQNLRRAMLYARNFNFALWLYPQDAVIGQGGMAHEGAYATRFGLVEIPPESETLGLQIMLELVRATGARVHFCRLSCARSVDLVRAAKAEGLPITADVAITHLLLNEFDLGYFDTARKLYPPLRGASDCAALSQGVKDGTIDAICSDHRPVSLDQKRLPFGEAAVGGSLLELLLPLTLEWARAQAVPVGEALVKITRAGAALLRETVPSVRPQPVGLQVGEIADLCVVDSQLTWRVRGESLYSQGHQTPFEDHLLQSCVTYTLIGGRVVFERATHS